MISSQKFEAMLTIGFKETPLPIQLTSTLKSVSKKVWVVLLIELIGILAVRVLTRHSSGWLSFDFAQEPRCR